MWHNNCSKSYRFQEQFWCLGVLIPMPNDKPMFKQTTTTIQHITNSISIIFMEGMQPFLKLQRKLQVHIYYIHTYTHIKWNVSISEVVIQPSSSQSHASIMHVEHTKSLKHGLLLPPLEDNIPKCQNITNIVLKIDKHK